MQLPDPDRAPIFVVGCGRSGTTLLRLMLNAHSRIHLTHESMLYVLRIGLPRAGDAHAWFERYSRTFAFAWLRLDPAAVRAALPPRLPRARLADVFGAVMRAKAHARGKPRYGDKTPLHSGHLRRIFHDFADARVIHMVRDPRANVASLLRMPWGTGSHGLAAYFCKLDWQCARRFRDRICTVRLEDLLAEPRAEMERILAFVGEPWEDAVLDHERHVPSDDVPPFPWLLSATEPRRPAGASGAGDGWRQALTEERIRNIEWQCRRLLREAGYTPAVLAREPGRWARLGAALADLPEGLRYLQRLWRAVRALRRRMPDDASESQRRFLGLNPRAWAHYPGFAIPDPPPVPGARG